MERGSVKVPLFPFVAPVISVKDLIAFLDISVAVGEEQFLELVDLVL